MTAGGVHAEALAAAAYAVTLIFLALALEGLARYTGWQAHRYREPGFRYHRALDVWECHQGEHLRPSTVDAQARVVRYRARAHVCNACPVKPHCTESDHGREIRYNLTPWLETGIGQFHRGMSLFVLGLAGLIALIELFQHPTPVDGVMLGAVVVVAGILGGRLYASLRSASESSMDDTAFGIRLTGRVRRLP